MTLLTRQVHRKKLFVLHNWTFCTSIDRHFSDARWAAFAVFFKQHIHLYPWTKIKRARQSNLLSLASNGSDGFQKVKKGLWFLFQQKVTYGAVVDSWTLWSCSCYSLPLVNRRCTNRILSFACYQSCVQEEHKRKLWVTLYSVVVK